MPRIHLDEPYRLSMEQKASSIAAALIAGQVSVTEAVRGLVPVLRELQLDGEEVFDLVGVDSELDGLPVGSIREHWNSDALEREDAKRFSYEEQVRNQVIACCHAVMAKFGTSPE